MSIELAFAMAFVWRRTLVLPPIVGNPLNPKSYFNVSDFFDLGAMDAAVKTISTEDFIAYAKRHPHRFPGGSTAVDQLRTYPPESIMKGKSDWEWPGWLQAAGVAENIEGYDFSRVVLADPTGLTEDQQLAVTQTEEYRQFATCHRASQPPFALTPAQANATALRLPQRVLLGNFYTAIYTGPEPELGWLMRSAVRRGVRLRREFFEAAEAALETSGLRIGEYSALHLRQGDWQSSLTAKVAEAFVDLKSPEKFLAARGNDVFVHLHGKMFVAHNAQGEQLREMENIFLPAMQKSLPGQQIIVTLKDKVKEAARQVAMVSKLRNWEGPVEMIICSLAGAFIGTWASTYSGYVHRLRGYMPFVADKRILFQQEFRNNQTFQHPTWDMAKNVGQIAWEREWVEAFI
eukprot:g14858.t1